MRMMSASEASRSFASVLDQAEHGETIVITRNGRRLAILGPAPSGNGAALAEVLEAHAAALDEDFASDVLETRELLTLEHPWEE
ncbi:type II toxin-antitoxin system prevent-host-death family antitoxin [Streptomyces sp. WMMC500]|uniref:type II toxin-antitoxin system Phd/YefM family antitoxin n=1 Tax=Streptomyces sp. WMMC500 TaxID=3015154 RepID=UPI00248C2CB6|nr:type II toxin-antitoxin system prevent-host-death family antitoxin [Streptomyces sp. WMMC500]WBB57728.1 type II toxin-antitoxin system prevent-host-death family antitoxin [Streptomyces sp. WMMC500]